MPATLAIMERIAVVTGATGGMGAEIVKDLAADHHVYAVGRNEERLAELAENPNVTPVAFDLTRLLTDQTPEQLLALESIDLLVHGAGMLERLSVAEATATDWTTALSVNTIQPALLTRVLLPALRSAQGQIVFINSFSAQAPSAESAVYAASKSALKALADALRDEVSPDGVRVASLFPSGTDTAMMRRSSAQMGDAEYHPEYYTAPVEIARAVRMIADTGESTQFTNLDIRPRRP